MPHNILHQAPINHEDLPEEGLTLFDAMTQDLINQGMNFSGGGSTFGGGGLTSEISGFQGISGLSGLQPMAANAFQGWTPGVDMGSTVDQHASQNASSSSTNALPSIPAMSNVGTNSFTGVVNWNAVPGGFQPLPQTAGRSKRLYQLSQFHGGINQKSSPRDISDSESREATNVTVSQIGTIKPLGDIKNTDNSIAVNNENTVADKGAAGYGLFQFVSPAALDGTAGEYVITLSPDGDTLDAFDSTGTTDAWLDYGGSSDNANVAHVVYAAGNGVYACDANFAHTSANNPRKAKIYVYREDAGDLTVSGWKSGKALIDSPKYDSDAHGDMAAGTVKCVARSDDSEHLATVASTLVTECDPNGTGTWDGTYYFYISWLFDGGTETGLTSYAEDSNTNDQNSDGIAFSDNKLELNI